ncbi:MAG TPA: TIGR02301 family protein [Microvirga sp.]|nr:TIGR02301 family protein [Microvirga sp.]
MRRLAGCLAVSLVLPAAPAGAQSFFERMFRPPGPPPQAQPPQPVPQSQPRRSAPAQPPASQPAAPQPQPAPAAIPEPPPPPYEKEMLRMAEIMGSLAFLRSLCTTPDAAEWPQRMQQLMDAEGTTPGRKERLAGAYNRGYRAFAVTYRVCTPSATEATNRYLKEGDQIARTLSGRYGG